MKNITVTMPLKEYEQLKERLEIAESRSVQNYIKTEWIDVMNHEYKTLLDVERMKKDFGITEEVEPAQIGVGVIYDGKKIAESLFSYTSLQNMGRGR